MGGQQREECTTNEQTDRHMAVQRETIIPHYRVAGYKKHFKTGN